MVIAVALAVTAISTAISMSVSPVISTLGEPVIGKSLATVHIQGRTAYFPGVACVSNDPTELTVSFGHPFAFQVDPVAFVLAASLVPEASTAGTSAPFTSMVLGHRPGVVFNQQGTGSVTVDSALQASLATTGPTGAMDTGTLAFHGTDVSGAQLYGVVACGNLSG
jgi:hypothetical protein